MLTLSGKSLGGKCNCTKWPPNHGLPLFGDHACAHILSPYILPLLVETQVLVALRSRAISRLQSMRDRFLAIWAHKLSDQCDVLFVRFHSPYIYRAVWPWIGVKWISDIASHAPLPNMLNRLVTIVVFSGQCFGISPICICRFVSRYVHWSIFACKCISLKSYLSLSCGSPANG